MSHGILSGPTTKGIVMGRYMRRSGASRVHKINMLFRMTDCGQDVNNAGKWVKVDEEEWTISPCPKCKGK